MGLRLAFLYILIGTASPAFAAPPCPQNDPAAPLLEPILKATNGLDGSLFQACFGENRGAIPSDVVTQLFNDARQDPFTHMKTPEIYCLHRAYVLLGEIFQKGYQARIVHIEASPTLIGLTNFNAASPTHSVDYQGKHWVVAVNVKGPDGRITPEILDPQFMQNPASFDEYFRLTTGQSCHTGSLRGKWDCNYEEITPTSFFISQLDGWFGFADVKTAGLAQGCSWPLMDKVRKEIDAINRRVKTTLIPIPPEVLSLKDPDRIRTALILEGLENRRKELEEKILHGGVESTNLESQIQELDEYPGIFAKVKANLEQPAQ